VTLTLNGSRAVSASTDGTLKVWDLATGCALRKLDGHFGPVWGVAATEDGKRAVSASEGKTLEVWDLESGLALHTLEGHADRVLGVALMSAGKKAVSASYDKTLKGWDLETGAVLASFSCNGVARCCACGAPNHIVAGDSGGRVYFLALEE
jgi:WD40 repeat protein